jgi:hypothetical protein
VIEEGVGLAGTACRVVVKRLEGLGGNLPSAVRELLVMGVSRLLGPVDRQACGDVDVSECRVG